MGRKAQVKRSPEGEVGNSAGGLRSGNISETCRKHGIAANLWHRW
jgi:transposase-like protein